MTANSTLSTSSQPTLESQPKPTINTTNTINNLNLVNYNDNSSVKSFETTSSLSNPSTRDDVSVGSEKKSKHRKKTPKRKISDTSSVKTSGSLESESKKKNTPPPPPPLISSNSVASISNIPPPISSNPSSIPPSPIDNRQSVDIVSSLRISTDFTAFKTTNNESEMISNDESSKSRNSMWDIPNISPMSSASITPSPSPIGNISLQELLGTQSYTGSPLAASTMYTPQTHTPHSPQSPTESLKSSKSTKSVNSVGDSSDGMHRSNSSNQIFSVKVSQSQMKKSRSASSLRKLAAKGAHKERLMNEELDDEKTTNSSESNHVYEFSNASDATTPSTFSSANANANANTNTNSNTNASIPIRKLQRQDSKYSICTDDTDLTTQSLSKKKSGSSKKKKSLSRQSSFRSSVGNSSKLSRQNSFNNVSEIKYSKPKIRSENIGKETGIKFERQERRIDWMINTSQLETPSIGNYRTTFSDFQINLPTRKSIHFGSSQVRDTGHFLFKDKKDYTWDKSNEEEKLKQKRRNSLLSSKSFSSPALLKNLSDIPVIIPTAENSSPNLTSNSNTSPNTSSNTTNANKSSLSTGATGRKSIGSVKLPPTLVDIKLIHQKQIEEEEKTNELRKLKCKPLTKAAKREKHKMNLLLKKQQDDILFEKSLEYLAIVDFKEAALSKNGKEAIKRVQRALSSNALFNTQNDSKLKFKSQIDAATANLLGKDSATLSDSQYQSQNENKHPDLHIDIPPKSSEENEIHSPSSTTSSITYTNNAVTVPLTGTYSAVSSPASEADDESSFSSNSNSPNTPNKTTNGVSESNVTSNSKKRRFSLISLESTIIDVLGKKGKKRQSKIQEISQTNKSMPTTRRSSFSRAPSRDFSWLVHNDLNPSAPGQYNIDEFYDQLDSTKIHHRIARPVSEQDRLSWNGAVSPYHTALHKIPSSFSIETPSKSSAFGTSRSRMIPDRKIEDLWFTEIPPHIKKLNKDSEQV